MDSVCTKKDSTQLNINKKFQNIYFANYDEVRTIKGFKFELIHIIKSIWSIIYFIPLFAIFIMNIASSDGIAGVFINDSIYFNLYLVIFLPMLCIYKVHDVNDFELSLNSAIIVYIRKALSVMCFAGIFPIIIIIYAGLPMIYSSLSFPLFLNFSLYITVTWGIQILFCTGFGFFLGLIIRHKIAYVTVFISAIAISPIFQIFLISNDIVEYSRNNIANLNLLNLIFDEPWRLRRLGYGFSFNTFFWSDILIYCFVAVILSSLTFLIIMIAKKAFTNKFLQIGICLCIIILSSYGFYQTKETALASYPIIYSAYDGEEIPSKFDNKVIDENYRELSIISYEMDVDLNSNFKNTCSLEILNTSNNDFFDTLKLKLDECFNIDSIKIENEEITFRRTNDYIEIENIHLLKNKIKKIEIIYSGTINYCDDLLTKNVFADNNSANLPEIFAWYPKLETLKNQINFTIDVRAKNHLVSNLSNHTVLSGKNEYKLSGEATDVYLVSGYFSTISIDEYTITSYEELINIETMKKEINEIKNGEYEIPNTPLMIYEDGHNSFYFSTDEMSQIKTLFFYPYSYNAASGVYYFDGAIILTDTVARW